MILEQKTINDVNSLRIWERLQLVVGTESKEGVYTCRISDIRKDCLVISRPVFSYGKSLLANNRTVQVNFTRADAAYYFRARIRETEPKSEDEMFLVELGEVRRLQRRRFVRVEKTVKCGYFLLEKPIRKKISIRPGLFQKAYTINISAGGLLMPVREDDDIGLDDLLLIDFSRGSLRTLNRQLIAVVRQARQNDDMQRVAGVEFILNEDLHLYLSKNDLAHIPEQARQFTLNMQNELVSEVFNEQLALRQKGLI